MISVPGLYGWQFERAKYSLQAYCRFAVYVFLECQAPGRRSIECNHLAVGNLLFVSFLHDVSNIVLTVIWESCSCPVTLLRSRAIASSCTSVSCLLVILLIVSSVLSWLLVGYRWDPCGRSCPCCSFGW